jgi:hypothetical protein
MPGNDRFEVNVIPRALHLIVPQEYADS